MDMISDGPDKQELLKLIIQEKTKQSEERTKQLKIENESKQGMLITTTTITSTHSY